jgi:hypothetical protein
MNMIFDPDNKDIIWQSMISDNGFSVTGLAYTLEFYKEYKECYPIFDIDGGEIFILGFIFSKIELSKEEVKKWYRDWEEYCYYIND